MQMLRSVLAAVLLAVVVGKTVKAPETCFEDGTCLTLYDYVADDEVRASVSPPFYSTGLQKLQTAKGEPLYKYRADLQQIGSYVGASFMGGRNSELRQAEGKDVPDDLLNATALLASGLNILRKNATVQGLVEPDLMFFRGEPDYAGAPCPNTKKTTGTTTTDTTRTIWAFDSWTRTMRMAAMWSSYSRVLMLHKRKLDGGGAYIAPFDIPAQYEFVTIPGMRVKSIACEQFTFELMDKQKETVSIEYLYDISTEDELSPSEEAKLLKRMQDYRDSNLASCFGYSCTCAGAAAAGPNADPEIPIPNDRCKPGSSVSDFKAEDVERFTDVSGLDRDGTTFNVAALVAGVLACCAVAVVAAVVVSRRRRGYASFTDFTDYPPARSGAQLVELPRAV